MTVVIEHRLEKNGLLGMLLRVKENSPNSWAIALITFGDTNQFPQASELDIPNLGRGDLLLKGARLFVMQTGLIQVDALEWMEIPITLWWDKMSRPSFYRKIVEQAQLQKTFLIRPNHVIYADKRTWFIQQFGAAEKFLSANINQSPAFFLNALIHNAPQGSLIEIPRSFMGCTTTVEAPKVMHHELYKYLCYRFPGIEPTLKDMPVFRADVFCQEAFIPNNSPVNSTIGAIGLCESIDNHVRHFLRRFNYE